MSLDARAVDYSQFVDSKEGLVDRRIFSDPAIFEMELEQIFARAWNFMCHESQIREVGDFFMNRIGNDQVIVVRNKKKEVSVLLNSCRHRGNAVCRAELGRAKTFLCPYHGWSYGLDGELIGVPGLKDYYRDGLERKELALGRAAQVASYKGFVFATMDPKAPPLEEYLGEVGRIGLDFVVGIGEVEVVDGIQKNIIDCNWKMAVDNLFDWYHPYVSHKSAFEVGLVPGQERRHPDETMKPLQQMVMLGRYGHAIGGPRATDEDFEQARQPGMHGVPGLAVRAAYREQFERTMGPVGVRALGHPNIFPNLWITMGGAQACLRVPRGPQQTELWWFTFVPKGAPEPLKTLMVKMGTHVFGPAGLLEQDDGENWQQCTRGSVGTLGRRYPQYLAMGLGRDRVTVDGGQARIETVLNEHAQRWTYQAWSDWMMARDWDALKANHTSPPTSVV